MPRFAWACLVFIALCGLIAVAHLLQSSQPVHVSIDESWLRPAADISQAEPLEKVDHKPSEFAYSLVTMRPHDSQKVPPEVFELESETTSTIPPTIRGTILRGKNLILAGDSNDRNFFQILCQHLTGKFDAVQHVRKMEVQSGEYKGQITWPTDAATMLCNDHAKNASMMFLFHQGVYSLPPQPSWYLEFANRRLGTHGIGVRGKARVVPTTDLARYVWPETITQHLPTRPAILLMQSSMWDSFAVLEKIIGMRVSQMTEEGLSQIMTARFSRENLTDWGWLDRASQILAAFREGLVEQGLPVSAQLWRTNPNCPALPSQGSVVANPLSQLYAEAVQEAIGHSTLWSDVCLVDWRGHLEIKDPSQCDHHHYTKAGYEAYFIALGDCVRMA